MAFRGLRHISRLHGPAVVGQAAVFSAYIDECRSRLHTGASAWPSVYQLDCCGSVIGFT